MLLTQCPVDLLHLDQFKKTLSNVGGIHRPCHARNYLGPGTTWALLRFSIWNNVSVDSATLSTTGCCRSRSFSSDNHRNSCNNISTCCPLVCYDVHTSKLEFTGWDALVLWRSVFATKFDHLNGFLFDGRCTCRYCCTGRLRINQFLSNTILPEGSRFTRVGSPPPKRKAWPVRATNKLIQIYFVPRKGFQ